jgi:Ca2+-transporting ATPase
MMNAVESASVEHEKSTADIEERGISEDEAARLLKTEGSNELPSAKQRSLFGIASDVLREPVFLLLVACGLIYLFLGDRQEAVMLLGFVVLIAVITLYQEHKTERTLEALRDLSSPRALVIRDGVRKRVAGREVVRGDVIVVSEGDRVPADACLISATNLSIDESLLTGESVAVRKSSSPYEEIAARPGGDDLPFVYSGTLVVQGSGIARVTATGLKTEMGRIGKALMNLAPETTLLQKETSRWVKLLATLGLLLCAIVVLLHGFGRGNWLEGILAGLTLAMAILPNELPVVLTIFLALGAWRISKRNVLTRRIPAIEMLGSASVICVDKTGTVTLNKMSLDQLNTGDRFLGLSDQSPVPEEFHQLLEFAILASQRDPFDPMEKAINEAGNGHLRATEHLHADWMLIRQYPLSPELLALSHVWRSPSGTEYVIAAKGAPEAIVELCHLEDAETDRIKRRVVQMAGEGLRVLGVAKAQFQASDLPPRQHDFSFEFLGLIGLQDPVREGVYDAVQECHTAGIRVVMITGDYPATAMNIGRKIGLQNADACITGRELDEMSDEQLRERIKQTSIFARVVPEQKLRLVEAFKANGEIVAMTGDGVNDAPALKAAHIGIAMGGRGTDVAREAASLVLLDDNFTSIVHAVRLGRRIFDNLRKAIAYTLATHIPIVGMTLIPALMNWPLVLLPFHIAFLHLIIDPACSVVLEAEPEEATVMRRPPRRPQEPLFGRRMLWVSSLQGIVVLAFVLLIFVVALTLDRGEQWARALSFATLVLANLTLILTNRSWTRTLCYCSR